MAPLLLDRFTLTSFSAHKQPQSEVRRRATLQELQEDRGTGPAGRMLAILRLHARAVPRLHQGPLQEGGDGALPLRQRV